MIRKKDENLNPISKKQITSLNLQISSTRERIPNGAPLSSNAKVFPSNKNG